MAINITTKHVIEMNETIINVDTNRRIETDVEYDTLLSSAGELGRYQFLLLFTTFPFYMFGVFVYFSQIFITEVPNHWCWIPELENLTDIERKNLAIPKDNDKEFSKCYAYDANWTEVLLTGERINDTWKTVPCQNGWEFDRTSIPYPTISSDFEWVCDRSSYQATAQSIFFSGSVVGGILIGWVADRYGRIPAVVTSNLLGFIGGLSSTFVTNFAQFTICRFVMGMAYDSCMILTFLIVLEYMAPKYRSVLSNASFGIFFSLFATTFPFIALACGHWKTISLVTSLPLGLAILTPLFIPESPRWLLSRGRINETIDKILVIAGINRKQVPSNLIQDFKATASRKINTESVSGFEIIKRPLLRKVLILVCVTFTCCQIVFDGLIRNLEQLKFNFFLSFAASSFTEFPSILLCAFIMDVFGRRWLAFLVLTISCVFSILTVCVGNGVPSVVCAVVARFGSNMSCNILQQWAAELLPTPVRGSGLALIHVCSNIAIMISPYITYLKIYVDWLPFVIIGGLAGLGAVIALILPETAMKEMPHTFEDAEALARNLKMWDMPCLRKYRKESHVNEGFEM